VVTEVVLPWRGIHQSRHDYKDACTRAVDDALQEHLTQAASTISARESRGLPGVDEAVKSALSDNITIGGLTYLSRVDQSHPFSRYRVVTDFQGWPPLGTDILSVDTRTIVDHRNDTVFRFHVESQMWDRGASRDDRPTDLPSLDIELTGRSSADGTRFVMSKIDVHLAGSSVLSSTASFLGR
jgi:hypothetical protein